MNDRIYALGLFARVARTGSFSAAGREFNVSRPSASGSCGSGDRRTAWPAPGCDIDDVHSSGNDPLAGQIPGKASGASRRFPSR